MKAVTVHLDEEVYARYQALARLNRQTASELIRLAMAEFSRVRNPAKTSLRESPPARSVGKIFHSWESRSDLLEEFFDRS